MQVRSIGKRDAAFLFQLGDELIMYAPLHELLAASVPAFLPINIAEARTLLERLFSRLGSCLRP